MNEETKEQQGGAPATSPAADNSQPESLTKLIGPYGETLSVVAFACVLVLLLFMLPLLGWYALPLTIGLLVVAAFAFRAALSHAEWLKQEEARIGEEEETILYQVTEARLLTLKAVGVPNDIITIMMKDLGLVSLLPRGTPATRDPLPPRPKKAFMAWLIHDLGLGEVRVKEYREKILTYTVYDRRENEQAQEAIQPSILAASQTMANGGANLQAH